jgi:hypothetical protein
MIRASEPPTKARRVSPAFVHMIDFMSSSIAKDRVLISAVIFLIDHDILDIIQYLRMST